MNRAQLAEVIGAARCKVSGWEDAGNDGHRLALATIVNAFNHSESAVLCEASLARKTSRPPDIVLIDPEIGVHVVEVKSITLAQIEAIEAGGRFRIRYGSGVRATNPIVQVRNAMFDIRDATARTFESGELRLPFKYWVAFPFVTRSDWVRRFGDAGFCPPEFIFADELVPELLARRMGASERSGTQQPIDVCPLDQLQCVWRAFGDTSVLYATTEEREPRRSNEGTLGEKFDEAAESHKILSDEQQRLSAMNWESGPRLVRGVAGSGKTIVLANNLARRLERTLVAQDEGLFDTSHSRPRLLAVCYNRTLAPFIRKKIDAAFHQRTGSKLPDRSVDTCSFNTLMWKLAEAGLWRYQSVKVSEDARAIHYLADLEQVRQREPARLSSLAYDAIYVDEGQDFMENELRLLKELCRTKDGGEPDFYVFYDDAQNLFGRGRPNWQSLGLNVRGGRSFVMTECFRNTRPIAEASFNLLYASAAAKRSRRPSKEYGNIDLLDGRGLIQNENGFWRVRFARREGQVPRIAFATTIVQETELVTARLRWLIENQHVRPQDILVLTFLRQRAAQLADAVEAAQIPGVSAVHLTLDHKDQPLGQKGRLTVSTVASAKGYDAYCVLVASANEFRDDLTGRANLYVACTRALEHLDVFAYENNALATEVTNVFSRIRS